MRNWNVALRTKLLAFGLGILVFIGSMAFTGYKIHQKFYSQEAKVQQFENFRAQLREDLSESITKGEFPEDVVLQDGETNGNSQDITVNYTIDQHLQEQAEKLFRQYKPDYGALVAIDATSGKILSLVSYQKDGNEPEHLALRATYPAASVFKIITASAAVDKYQVSPNTKIQFNGSNHTLYRKNVMDNVVNRWTRAITLKEAFAKSINTVFAKLSFEWLKPLDIKEYAERFWFNKKIESDFNVDTSFASVPKEKSYELAEIASGFNKLTRMSPVQGAMIAAAVAQDGVMHLPYLVDSVYNDKQEKIFFTTPETISYPLSTEGAARMKTLMEATVLEGTGRKSFRDLVRSRKYVSLQLGGKTGSLFGDHPQGKVDWFVGYAIGPNDKIAIAALTVNKKKWVVKSAYLAQYLFQSYFQPEIKAGKAKVKAAHKLAKARKPASRKFTKTRPSSRKIVRVSEK